jgi:hypothetical protein
MDIYEITANQLKRAAAIKEQVERLNKELGAILGGPVRAGATRSVGGARRAKKKTMSPAARRKLSAKLKAYWAQKKSGKK